jgi:DNA repair protein RecO (recombination protein O)
MPPTFTTEAIVLRSIRYGEADRVLHLYTRDRGRVGAIAKGVRRVKSRFGGRLEPMARSELILREGRGDLCTVTSADTVDAHAGIRSDRQALDRAVEACAAVLKLLDSQEPNPPAVTGIQMEHAIRLSIADRAQHDRLRGERGWHT